MDKCMFSILMCARNAEKTIEYAIQSVRNQNCSDWEIVVLDNASSDETWNIIERWMKIDDRIKGIHLEKGIGWPKGASVCLDYARGEYMIFLAADDFLLEECLSSVQQHIEQWNPDIVWIGHEIVQRKGEHVTTLGECKPEFKVYVGEGDRISNVAELMQSLYYNSFFHFERISFLKENNIDFFEPYYADFEGMTEAMCRAKRMVVVDKALYALTENTSQTRGTVTWRYPVNQWKTIKKTVVEQGKYNREILRYLAIRIFNNNMAMLEGISQGMTVLDKEMNPIEKNSLERLEYWECCLEIREFEDGFYYAGRQYYASSMFTNISRLYSKCLLEYSFDDISKRLKWLDKLVTGLCLFDGQKVVKKESFYVEDFKRVKEAICNENNIGRFGYELLGVMVPFVNEDTFEEWQEIQQSFLQWELAKIYELLGMAEEIKNRGRKDELIIVVREAMELINNVKDFLDPEEIKMLVGDAKMVLNS